MNKAPKPIARLIRYSITGTIGAIIDIGLLAILTEGFKIYYLNSAIASFILATIIVYNINRNWAFKDTKRKYLKGLLYFILFSAICLFLTITILKYTVENFQVNYLFAKTIIFIVISTLNFIANYYLTFKIK